MTQTSTRQTRLYKEALDDAENLAGGKRAFMIVGPSIRQAFVAQAALRILATQDEDVPDRRVRELLFELTNAISEDQELLS